MQESLELQIQQLTDAIPHITGAILVVLLMIVIGRVVSNSLDRILRSKRTKAIKQTRLLKRLVRWGFNLFGVILALNVLGLTQAATSFLAAGGVVAVVLGFAFREIGENLLAGFFLSFSRSFDVGDLIESNGIRGIVKRIEVREVHIRTADGCDIFIPSAIIYKNPLYNFTRDGLRRSDFTIGIDYGDNPQKAREVLLGVLQASDLITDSPAATVQVAGFAPSFIELKVFFWINTFEENPGLAEVRSILMNSCHKALEEEGFTFSSNVTTAVDMLPVDVRLNNREENRV